MDGRLAGLGLRFYRGIGPETQFVGPFSQFNFFAGANNAGKSIILNCLHEYFPPSSQAFMWDALPSNSVHWYKGQHEGTPEVSLGIRTETLRQRVFAKWCKIPGSAHLGNWIEPVLSQLSYGDVVWFQVNKVELPERFSLEPSTEDWLAIIPDWQWREISNLLGGQYEGSVEADWLPQVLRWLLSLCITPIAPTVLIQAIRRIGPAGNEMVDHSGEGLIDRLHEIQNPDIEHIHEREIFSRINEFLQFVTGKADAKIDIPYNLKHVLVHIDGKVLPLTSLGTGIHEVVMIAAFCLLNERSIICIEEPEIHLHPVLQRKLVKYLKDNTDSQYFIATHSPTLIDMPEASVFHVRNDGIQTHIKPILLRSDKRQLTDELGYKASDIIQANAVVWVEGPSDQIYIRHWLKEIAPELVEGIDFSIMFYGGRLLSHLSANPEELEEFINLRSLNQNSAIVMDSDKTSARVKINETKERLKAEFSDGGLCWITKGREIENYIDHNTLQDAVQAVHTQIYDYPLEGGAYDHALYFQRKKPRRGRTTSDKGKADLVFKRADKVAVARLVTESEVNLGVLDLNDRITELAEFLRKASL